MEHGPNLYRETSIAQKTFLRLIDTRLTTMLSDVKRRCEG